MRDGLGITGQDDVAGVAETDHQRTMKIEQRIIVGTQPDRFESEINGLLAKGWHVRADTLQIKVAAGSQGIYFAVVVVERSEKSET